MVIAAAHEDHAALRYPELVDALADALQIEGGRDHGQQAPACIAHRDVERQRLLAGDDATDGIGKGDRGLRVVAQQLVATPMRNAAAFRLHGYADGIVQVPALGIPDEIGPDLGEVAHVVLQQRLDLPAAAVDCLTLERVSWYPGRDALQIGIETPKGGRELALQGLGQIVRVADGMLHGTAVALAQQPGQQQAEHEQAGCKHPQEGTVIHDTGLSMR